MSLRRTLRSLLLVLVTALLVAPALAADTSRDVTLRALTGEPLTLEGRLDAATGNLELVGGLSRLEAAILRLWRVDGLEQPLLVSVRSVAGPGFSVVVALDPEATADLVAGRLLLELESTSPGVPTGKAFLQTEDIFLDGFESGATCAVWSSTFSVEVCDGADNDCDGVVDDDAVDRTSWHPDADEDGWGEMGSNAVVQCVAPADHVANASDCDDANPLVNPGVSEACDGIDNDCDFVVDEGGSLCFSTDPCFAATCGGAAGCLFDPNPGAFCSDGDACTTDDTCDELGSCAGQPVTCPPGASCQPLLGGACACDDPSASLCSDGCFDLLSDVLHCGGCDVACGVGQSCESGLCTDPPAPFVLDTEAATSASFGPAGGELQVVSGGLAARLVVPAGALLEDILITATPISSFPLVGFSSGVHLEPEGQSFLKPVQLRIAGAVDFAFGYDDQALDVHLRPASVEGTGPGSETVIELWHFSGAGAGAGSEPATAPSSLEAQALDAMARGDAAGALAPLTARWAEIEALLAQATNDRSAFDLAAAAFIGWRGLVEQAGFDADLGAELAEGESALLAGVVAERDRILAAAPSSNDWRVLLDLETWLLPRAQGMGLADDGSPVSPAALSAMLPMTVTLSDVSLTLAGQRYRLVGQGSASLAGGPPITDPPVEIDATVFGTVQVTVEGATDAGAFDIPLTQNREHLSANVLGSFSGFAILSVTDTATAAADNQAELAILVTASPTAFDVGDASNIEASVARGFGPLGLAGAVAFSLTGDSLGCSLGAPGGTPDGDGKVLTTVSCDEARVFTLEASISHRGETATDSASLEARGGLVGTYVGINVEYDYGDCNSCIPRDTRIIVEDDPVNGLTLYYCDSGSVASGWCTSLPQQSTMKYSIIDDGSGVITGSGSRPDRPQWDGQLVVNATLTGTTLTGNAFWQPGCPGGCYDAFEVTRVP